MEKQEKERQIEQRRINEVLKEISYKEHLLQEKSDNLKESVIDLRKNFWEDVTVNLDEPDDVIETQASIKQQAELLSERERSHGSVSEERKKLRRLKDEPYFGRIDFTEQGESIRENIYIGRSTLLDRQEEDILIYDWRAPISSLYYDYALGEAAYETMDGEVTGNISLKRQFIIRQGIMKGMFDTGLTIGDRLLQEALGNQASTVMKSIVATIQKEQNKIIRNENSDLLVVQGVAGSGKTSAVLQRIAYLLYRHRDELNENNMLLFSPNALFSSYISNVLPELGEANINQVTFLRFIQDRVGKYSVESPFEQMEFALTADTNVREHAVRLKAIPYKSSLAFKQLIDEYVEGLREHGMYFRNITLHGRKLISKEAIQDYFYHLDAALSIPNKMELTAKWLLKELRRIQSEEMNEDWVMEQVELMDKEEYQQAYFQNQAMDEDDFSLEEQFLREEVVKRTFKPIKKRVKHYGFVHVGKTYQALFAVSAENENTPENWSEICKQTVENISERILTWEDATPFLYLKDKLFGPRKERMVRHLFIDEAQDYSAFQFAYIKHTFPHTKMTLLGDSNQAIYTYATDENPLITNQLKDSFERIALTTSYRSTKQIVQFTKGFAPAGADIEPFEREGKKPCVVEADESDSLSKWISRLAEQQFKAGHETIGIICKTMQECELIYQQLKQECDVSLLLPDTASFEKGLLVLPVYLAKGIEFDAVIIPDASSRNYHDETDRNLFYTACTRAMHDLLMISPGTMNRFIAESPESTYERNPRHA